MNTVPLLLERRGDWIAQQVHDEMLMLNPERGVYVGLSPVARRIWELIETPLGLDAICAELVDEFDVAPGRCREEVDGFVAEMIEHGLAELTPR